MKRTLALFGVLALCGAAWGATQPLSIIAVSEGYRHFGILFWQATIGAILLCAITLARKKPLAFGREYQSLYLIIALLGSVLPGYASYSAAVHLPSGVLSILLSTIPMFAFPIALALGNDSFRWRRLLGLTLGLIGVGLLVLPDTSLPDASKAIWIPIALLSSMFYAIEGNVVASQGTRGLDAVQTLFGASLVAAMITFPLAIFSGHWINPLKVWGAPDVAIVTSSVFHALAYSGYVWLVAQAGSVFAVQVSYLVTLFGVIAAMLVLGEAYSPYFWMALVLMLAGLFFVQPRPRGVLAPVWTIGQTSSGSSPEGQKN